RRMDAIQQVFEDGGFPGVVGVIDGTHIPIRAPSEKPNAYINRKKFHSIQVQVLHFIQVLFTTLEFKKFRDLQPSTKQVSRKTLTCLVMEDIPCYRESCRYFVSLPRV
ncbi:hypothetical protein QZH41_012659, partial [Actinostola sp. cb2023]